MTLLMVLFIVMFAISQVDSKKFMALKTGLSAGFGAPIAMIDGADALLETGSKLGQDTENLAGVAGNTVPDPEHQLTKNAAKGAPKSQAATDPDVTAQQVAELAKAMSQAAVKGEVENLKKAEDQLKQALAKAGVEKQVTFRFDERGLIVSVATDQVLFESGSATLLPQGQRILDIVAPTLLTLPNKLSIDGHTNSAPISTAQFPSNWELSTARATGVLRYLASARKFPVSRMSATGFADTHPLKPKSDPTAMVANRRVEIVVLARVDTSSGQAVEQLGNATTPTTGTTRSATSSASDTKTKTTKTTPGAEASPAPHNLLGLDPSASSSTAAKAAG